MLHTMVVRLTHLHCNAMPACAARLEPKMPAPCMQPTANNPQRAYTCLLHGHAKHAVNSHAMQQLCAECAYMRVLLSFPISYQLGLTELAKQRSKAPKGSVPAQLIPIVQSVNTNDSNISTYKTVNRTALQTSKHFILRKLELGCSLWVRCCFLLRLISCYTAGCLDSWPGACVEV